MVRKDIFSGLFWLLFSLYFSVESYRLGLGEWRSPGPGYFPFGAILSLGIISLYVIVTPLRKKPAGEISVGPSERWHWWNIALIMLGMLAYILLLKRIGFVLCTFLLVVFFIRVVARQRWFNSLIIALSITLASHLLFNILLNAQLPSGIFRFLRGY